MLLPSLELALTGAIPFILAFRAPLGGSLATSRARWVLYELIVNIGAIKVHQRFHVLFRVIHISVEEVFHLVLGNFIPISVPHDIVPHLWKLLHNE
tara:strand:- start:232 stop:519 length:288 start_codon:yes stop_codon:yes gene_type:complete